MVPIEEVEKQTKLFKYFQDVLEISNHYNINKDLFNDGFFRPSLDLNITYESNDTTVYHGNRVPAEKVMLSDYFRLLDSNKLTGSI